MTIAQDEPALSVVVTIIDGGSAFRRVITALMGQTGAPPIEILVPVDATIREMRALSHDFPMVRFIDTGEVTTSAPADTPTGRHELFDRRRSAGIHHARAPLVALLEDRVSPRPDWARVMHRLHNEHPHAGIGGAIECAADDLLNWALYTCDYSRYALPFTSGRRGWVSDVNVVYKRRALDAVRTVWHTRFNEADVNRALIDRGETLYLSAEAVVDHRSSYTSLASLLTERFHWGRVFGEARASGRSSMQKLMLVARGPIVPVVLFLRHGRIQQRLGNTGRFLRAAPLILPLLTSWSLGEVRGTLSRRK